MPVRRIVANIAADDPTRAAGFYRDLLGLEIAMDLGWIVTFAGEGAAGASDRDVGTGSRDTPMLEQRAGAENRFRSSPQLSVMREGGSGTPVPDISIEVDDVDAVYARARAAGHEIAYEIADEPWGVRRFYVRDPFGRLVNVLAHR